MSNPEVVVVLGAGPGLGAAIATAFARLPATVVLLARNRTRLDELAGSLADRTGAPVHGVVADAADEASLREAFAEVRRRHGDPTVLVHNPSIAVEAPPTRTSLPDLMDGVRLTAGSLLVAAHEVVPAMRAAGRGTILVTGSGAATTGSTWSAGLGVQKAAVRNLSLSLAQELARDGINVSTVTIRGLLGTAGMEPDRIAEEYVRLHALTDQPPTQWQRELDWTGSA